MTKNIKVEFSGGLESLFDNKKNLELQVPADDKFTMKSLIDVLRKEHLTENEDMFMSGDSVHHGIMVMINDSDWELKGGADYKIENNGTLAFIFTLHGGC